VDAKRLCDEKRGAQEELGACTPSSSASIPRSATKEAAMLDVFRSVTAGSILGCLVALPGTASAQSQTTLVIGFSPGAIYDAYGRLVAKHLGRHLPGQPTIVVQNMPGAGTLRLANYLYTVAPKDGSTIGLFARGIPMQPLLDPQGIQFDALKFNWLGSASQEVSVVMAGAATSFKTIEDARRREMVLSASGTGADTAIFPFILNGVIGTKFKVVTGYPGNADMLLALERGEVDGNAGTSWTTLLSIKPDWIRDKKVTLLLQLANKKHPDLGQVPLVFDYAANESDRQVLDLVLSRQRMAYPFTAPPDVPPDRLQALRRAFDATMTDPEFLAEAKRQNLEINAVSAAEIAAIMRTVYASPPEVTARARSLLEAGKAVPAK
jgi:tripartite-type tricarboxylate transporter receptor subunit TctC